TQVPFGVVFQAQFDGIHAELDGQLVHGAFDRVHAPHGARGPHVDRRVQVEPRELVVESDVVAAVEQTRPGNDGLGENLEPRGLGDGLVGEGFERAVGPGTQRDARPVVGRCPKVNICWRVSDTRTDRFSSRAARTARNTWYCGRSPDSNAPPTKGETTRSSSCV